MDAGAGDGADLGKGNSCCFMRLEKFQRGVSPWQDWHEFIETQVKLANFGAKINSFCHGKQFFPPLEPIIFLVYLLLSKNIL